LPDVFGFYPAQFWIHKNHARLIEALSIVHSRAPKHDLKLICTGYRGLSGWPVTQRALERFGMTDRVIFLDRVPTEHLAAIYRAARFCVVPSLYEASSYPVIEAQLLRCPAMCAAVTSLPELVQDGAGLLFDPHNAEAIALTMLRWLEDPADAMAHADRGYERVTAVHSLSAYAASVVDLYKFVVATGA